MKTSDQSATVSQPSQGQRQRNSSMAALPPPTTMTHTLITDLHSHQYLITSTAHCSVTIWHDTTAGPIITSQLQHWNKQHAPIMHTNNIVTMAGKLARKYKQLISHQAYSQTFSEYVHEQDLPKSMLNTLRSQKGRLGYTLRVTKNAFYGLAC